MSPNGTHPIPDATEIRSESCRLPGSALRRSITIGLVCVVTLLWIKTYLGFVIVDGDSMLPTLHSGDLLLINKRAYATQTPDRGDVVVSRFRSELIVKRVVGLPGETVEVVSGGLRVNGAPMPEPHAMQHGTLNVGPGELFPGRIAVLGDNRTSSEYQLFYAVVPQESVIGKATIAFRWGRTGIQLWRT